ncbi:MAG TPA: GntR family transcriptional regulator [Paracoccaceae bacterium]|nr:GntR family transcriptional regulator [Paracoccaceae bacterium]
MNKVDRPQTSSSDPDSQTHQAYTEIERRIVSLELAPGQLVSENRLADALGLGRTPVREALKDLAREGLVVILPKRGIVVADIDVARQLRLLELRRAVEGFVAEAAARRATPEERATFARLAEAMAAVEAAEDGEAFLELDAEFNRLILTAARNEYATAAMKLTQGLSRRFWFAHYRRADNLQETIRLHAQIARAIADRDPARAREGLDRLLNNVEAFTRATLDPDRMS